MRILLAVPFLAACAAQNPGQTPARAEQQRMTELDNAALWQIQANTDDRLELARAEAELGSRDELVVQGSYLGRRTLSAAGRSRYRRGRTDPETDILACDDFVTNGAAQVEFLGAGGPRVDQHALDPDGDGLACNWVETLRQAAARARG
ncbi:hypothetical protein [Jannaschia aquimarina]|uniref:Excalibur calcium-binding domain-containing protein n=1 Tax=Jannaschia aquimarina TaxID=935700 RepID=A0A0D1D886_9RHOB|nr:hypothetical protein [Jannaschia aquimarina]KIT16143.1 hypothetical protein jaqu_21050 [Jannaschia aquimarina]SNT37209.1 hypothetical protein SAMN05421775_11338 [Jannaschia aquimarina]